MRLKSYLHSLLARYLGYYVPAAARVVEIEPRSPLLATFAGIACAFRPTDAGAYPGTITDWNQLLEFRPDRVILNGTLHFTPDIQSLLENLRAACSPSCRILIVYYSALWKPLFGLATRLGVKTKGPEESWIAPADVHNLLSLAGFELVTTDQRVLLPVWIPLLSDLVNRWLAPLPGIRALALVNIAVARPLPDAMRAPLSVSVVVAARNEAGNVRALVDRLPRMGPDDELIFVEGGSTDDTWETIQEVAGSSTGLRIKCARQPGRGKGDAVRTGFALAERDILMILDADLTVPPEELPKFYRAMVQGRGEFINGSRLVYPMEQHAMQFFNIMGNKFFAAVFTFLIGQPLKDTLCGTKVLFRSDYETLVPNRAYFGDFDPFGDFDLLFGAAKLGLKIVEVPVRYRERTYGTTNIRRWAHGWLLLRMVWFAARRIRFV